MKTTLKETGGHLYQLASVEAVRVGDRTVDTGHLLLAVLAAPQSSAAVALGTDLAKARSAVATLDRRALAAVGISLTTDPPPIDSARPVRPRLTPTASRLLRSLPGVNRPGQLFERVLEAILMLSPPDPASLMVDELQIDRAAVREKLEVRA